MKTNLKNKIAAILTAAITVTSFGTMNAFAFDVGYRSATEYVAKVDEYIESPTQNDWYKFTVTAEQIPTSYTITLGIPSSCVYNFDLRYQDSSSSRPIVVSNETIVSSTRKRTMRGIITEAGTYYVRIYSQNGTTSAMDSYNLSISYENKNKSCTYGYDVKNYPIAESTDWTVCADILGNYTLESQIHAISCDRNYKNAYTFISTNYDSDDESGYATAVKATPEQTAIAASYVYSGDVMRNPKFTVENDKIYTIDELMYYLWDLDQPIIFYLTSPTMPTFDLLKKYVILRDVNIGRNTITYYNPSSGNKETMDYDEFLSDGFLYSGLQVTYSGTNILNSNARRRIQAIYN